MLRLGYYMKYEINDPIHKRITFTEDEKRIIDHPYVQRLRLIRQLGFVWLVYPSAMHDRFSHSLGTMHVAGKFAEQIFYNESYSILARLLSAGEKRFLYNIIRRAGLLHDVGHAPFSHSAEEAMPRVAALDLPRSWLKIPNEKRIATHEDYSALLLAGMAEGKNAVLSRDEAEIIASLIHHKKIKIPQSWPKYFSKKVNAEALHNLVRLLVSSDIDADRMDYLIRDSHFTGVTYGYFDLPWLISNLGVVEWRGGYAMSISDSGIHALEHYLFARHHMYLQVYMHKTTRCFEYYFRRAIAERETTYKIPASRDVYVKLRDATLQESIFAAAEKNPDSWSGLLMRRQPAKRIARIWGPKKEGAAIFRRLEGELKKIGVRSFFSYAESKFFDLTAEKHKKRKKDGEQNLEQVPIVIVRKHFDVVSLAPLADYAFILKHYHRDIRFGDIYILPDDYRSKNAAIQRIIRRYHIPSDSEIVPAKKL